MEFPTNLSMQRLLVFSLILNINLVYAGEVKKAVVQNEKGLYTLDIDVIVDAEQSAVWKIITDYDHMDRLNDMVTESGIIRNDNETITVRTINKTCILLYCINARLVQNFQEINHTIINTSVDATQSDFNFGEAQWRISPVPNNRTRIQYHCKKKPSFWIPPVIGPIIMKKKMLSTIKTTMDSIEMLAMHG